jgi:hypothetical protein
MSIHHAARVVVKKGGDPKATHWLEIVVVDAEGYEQDCMTVFDTHDIKMTTDAPLVELESQPTTE